MLSKMWKLLLIFPVLTILRSAACAAGPTEISCEDEYKVSRIDIKQVGVNESSALELKIRCMSDDETKPLEKVELKYPGKLGTFYINVLRYIILEHLSNALF